MHYNSYGWGGWRGGLWSCNACEVCKVFSSLFCLSVPVRGAYVYTPPYGGVTYVTPPGGVPRGHTFVETPAPPPPYPSQMRLWTAFSSLDSDVKDGAVTTSELEKLFRNEATQKANTQEAAYWAARAAKLEVRRGGSSSRRPPVSQVWNSVTLIGGARANPREAAYWAARAAKLEVRQGAKLGTH